MALTDSSKASLLFFYGQIFGTRDGMTYPQSAITNLSEGRGHDLPVPFPFSKLGRYDVLTENVDNLVNLHWLGKF